MYDFGHGNMELNCCLVHICLDDIRGNILWNLPLMGPSIVYYTVANQKFYPYPCAQHLEGYVFSSQELFLSRSGYQGLILYLSGEGMSIHSACALEIKDGLKVLADNSSKRSSILVSETDSKDPPT